MPYRVNADLPSSAPGHPAEPAQEIFREAIGAARAGRPARAGNRPTSIVGAPAYLRTSSTDLTAPRAANAAITMATPEVRRLTPAIRPRVHVALTGQL